MTDLSSLDTMTASEKGAVMDVLHPVTRKQVYKDKEEKLPMRITCYGMDSKKFRARQREVIDERLSNPNKKRTSEDVEISQLETVVCCIGGWENILLDGKDLPFNHDNAIELLTRLPWLREDIDMFIANRANFLKG